MGFVSGSSICILMTKCIAFWSFYVCCNTCHLNKPVLCVLICYSHQLVPSRKLFCTGFCVEELIVRSRFNQYISKLFIRFSFSLFDLKQHEAPMVFFLITCKCLSWVPRLILMNLTKFLYLFKRK